MPASKKKTDLVTNLDLEFLNGYMNALKMVHQTVSLADGIMHNGNLSSHEHAKQVYNLLQRSYGEMNRIAVEMREIMETKHSLYYDPEDGRLMIIEEVKEEPKPKRKPGRPKKEST